MYFENKKPILVMGVGNILQSDDGIGVHVVEEMKKHPIPDDVELFDGGTSAIDLIHIMDKRKKLIVVDCVNGEQPPGTLFKFTPQDIHSQAGAVNSLHQLGLLEAIKMAEITDSAPEETVIFGVQPLTIDLGLEPSDEVKKVIPRVIDEVMKEVNQTIEEINSFITEENK